MSCLRGLFCSALDHRMGRCNEKESMRCSQFQTVSKTAPALLPGEYMLSALLDWTDIAALCSSCERRFTKKCISHCKRSKTESLFKEKNTIKTIKFKGCPQAQIYQLNTQRLCQTFYIPKPHIPKAQCVYLYMQEKSCKIEPFFLTQSVNFYRKETPLSGEDGH